MSQHHKDEYLSEYDTPDEMSDQSDDESNEESEESDQSERETRYSLSIPVYSNIGRDTGKIKKFTNLDRSTYNLLKWALDKCPELARYKRDCKRTVRTDPPQLGKTRAVCFKILYTICENLIYKNVKKSSNVFVTTMVATDQCTQLYNSLVEFEKEVQEAGKIYGFIAPKFKIACLKDITSGSLKRTLTDSLQEGGQIVLGLHNNTQINRLKECLDKMDQENPVPMLHIQDESDATVKFTQIMAARDRSMIAIEKYITCTIYVTASPIAHLFKDGAEMKMCHVICGDIPIDYAGQDSRLVEFVEIADSAEGWSSKQAFDIKRTFINDNNEFDPPTWFNKAIKHHLSCRKRMTNESLDLLIRVTECIANQDMVFNWLVKNYPNHPALIYNGLEMKLYIPAYDTSLSRWFKNSGYVQDGCVHTWTSKNVFYGDLKQKLKTVLESRNISTCLFTVVGMMADRGMRFKTTDHKWAPSGILAMLKDKTDYATLMQIIGRIYGRRGLDEVEDLIDGDVKYAYMSKKMKKILDLGHAATKRFTHYLEYNEKCSLSDSLHDIGMTRNETNTQMTRCSVNEQKTYVTVKKDKKNEPCEAEKKANAAADRALKKTKKAEKAEKEAKDAAKAAEKSSKEVKKLTENMFPKWAEDGSNIGRFMDALDPEAVYTEKELKKLTKEYGLSVQKVTKDSGHGKILEENAQGEYHLRPELVEAFNDHFTG
jgi:hypothetical protein